MQPYTGELQGKFMVVDGQELGAATAAGWKLVGTIDDYCIEPLKNVAAQDPHGNSYYSPPQVVQGYGANGANARRSAEIQGGIVASVTEQIATRTMFLICFDENSLVAMEKERADRCDAAAKDLARRVAELEAALSEDQQTKLLINTPTDPTTFELHTEKLPEAP